MTQYIFFAVFGFVLFATTVSTVILFIVTMLMYCISNNEYSTTDDDQNLSMEELWDHQIIGMTSMRRKQICVCEGKSQLNINIVYNS